MRKKLHQFSLPFAEYSGDAHPVVSERSDIFQADADLKTLNPQKNLPRKARGARKKTVCEDCKTPGICKANDYCIMIETIDQDKKSLSRLSQRRRQSTDVKKALILLDVLVLIDTTMLKRWQQWAAD